jgi:hypothetical protein
VWYAAASAAAVLAVLLFFVLAVLLFFVLAAPMARGQSLCGPAEEMTAGLLARYGERPVGRGRLSSGALLVMFEAPGGATVSFVLIRPDGLACLIAAADDWRELPAPPAPKRGI